MTTQPITSQPITSQPTQGARAPLAPAVIHRILASLLEENPGSALGAVGNDGFFIAMPESVPLAGHPVLLHARIATDLVTAEHRTPVVRAWAEMLNERSSRVAAELIDGSAAAFHFLDARPAYGVILAVVASESDLTALDEARARVTIRPRVVNHRHDDHGMIDAVDVNTERMLGWEAPDLVGRLALDFLHPEDQARSIEDWLAVLSAPGVTQRTRIRYRCADESWLWVEVSNTLLSDADGGRFVETELVDVSEEMAAHEALRTREQLLRRLTEALPSGVVQIDELGKIVYKNDRTDQLVGNRAATTLQEQLVWCAPQHAELLVRTVVQVLTDGADADLEVQLVPPADSHACRVCHVALRALTSEAGNITGAIVTISDVTHSTSMRDELTIRATYDALTGCHNRASVLALLEGMLEERVSGDGVAVVFIDLDGFKPVNDRYGHAAGDHVLTIAAERLRAASRADDIVGRVGGDEFLIVCPSLPDSTVAMQIAQRVADRIRDPIMIGTMAVDVSASVGVAWSADPRIDADALIARADTAMYESKVEGAGRPVVEHAA